MAVMNMRVIVILVLLWGCSLITDAAAQVKESTTAEPFPLNALLPGEKKPVKVLRIPAGQTFTITLRPIPPWGTSGNLPRSWTPGY